MRRRFDLLFTALQVPVDALALIGASITAYTLRFSPAFLEIRPALQQISLGQYAASSAIFIGIWMLCFWLAGMYPTKPRPIWQEWSRILLGSTAGMMAMIATVFFQREVTTSRFIVLALWALTIVYVVVGRSLLRLMRLHLLRKGIGHQRIAVIGTSNAAASLKTLYQHKRSLGYTVVASYKTWNTETEEKLLSLKRKGAIDGLLLAEPRLSKEDALDLIRFSEEEHLRFRYLADLFAARFTRIDVTSEDGIPLIEPKRTPLDGWGRIAKRTFDIAFSLALLLLVAPIMVITALIIALQDGFPVLFHNERVGESGTLFNVYKFRSMWKKYCIGPQFSSKTNTENIALEQSLIQEKSLKKGPVYKIQQDPRITPFGHLIRRWSIDELPQIFNVLRGNMSFVGPRPHQPREVEKYAGNQRYVFAIKPGITGMAQVSGRSNLSFEEENRLDSWYIENWSPMLDLIIVLKTPLAILKRDGAY